MIQYITLCACLAIIEKKNLDNFIENWCKTIKRVMKHNDTWITLCDCDRQFSLRVWNKMNFKIFTFSSFVLGMFGYGIYICNI